MSSSSRVSSVTKQKEYKVKVCLVGEKAVGKTSLIRRYVLNMFDDGYITTIGTKVSKKEVMVNDTIKVTMLIWDILGQDEFQFLHATYYQGSAGALIVCDGTIVARRGKNTPHSYRAVKVREQSASVSGH